MANQFLNEVTYANVMLLLLKNNLVTGRLVDGRFMNQVTNENGLITSVKRPPKFIDKKESYTGGSAAALRLQDVIVGSVPLAVDQYSKVHVSIGDIEYVSNYNALMQNSTMKSAAQTLAHSIDSYLQSQLLKFASWVGTPGEDIKNAAQFNPVHTRLMNMGVPDTDLSATIAYDDREKIAAGLAGAYIDGVNRTALEKGRIPILTNIDTYATQQGPTLTTGTRTTSAAAQVDGATENVNYRDVKTTMVSTLSLKGLTNGDTIKAGEVLTIAGVYAYDNRAQPGQALPYLQQLTIVADVTVTGTTEDVVVSPAIIVPGTTDGVSTDANTAFGTVNSIPADSAAVTWVGVASTRYKIRAAWHKQGIAMVSAKLQSPFTGVFSFATDPETGISIRYWRGSDISTGAHVHRWDAIYGANVTDVFLGSRVNGLAL